MAATLGEPLGGTVGYRIRRDSRVGPTTRIEVVTEGILTRQLQRDPALEGVGLVIFDEFHERSLHADLGLALALQSRALLRNDLRILVMSATLEGEPVARLIHAAPGSELPAPIITSEGRSHPVDTRYLPRPLEGRIEPAVAAAVRRAVAETDGDLLVFLPGAGEIQRTHELLSEDPPGRGVQVVPLFGDLPQEAQDRALSPAPPGSRKVVLATAIAETSLTIEGVRVVIDSGRMRVPRFSPRTGLSRLVTVPVTADSAEQRRGRAGRLGPGVCYRLWTEVEQGQLVPRRTPEILSADLAPLALELAAWGVGEARELDWLDPPPAAALAHAAELLETLGALRGGRITAHGREISELGLHPRLASMVVRGRAEGSGAIACDLAALLSERDVFRRGAGPGDPDMRARLEALQGRREARADVGALRRVRAEARHWRARLGIPASAGVEVGEAGEVLALAYPDRVAQRRPGGGGRYLLRSGRGATLVEEGALAGEGYLVACDLDDRGSESRIFLAAPLGAAEVERIFAEQIERREQVAWDAGAGAVLARWQERLGALVLREGAIAEPDPEAVAAALVGAIRAEGLDILPWSAAALQLRQRVAFLRRLDPSWPDLADGALLARLEAWLAPHLHGMRRREDLRRLDLEPILFGLIGWEGRAELDESAPTHLTVPSGSRIAIDYSDPDSPVVAVKLQEMFGQVETPTVGGGRVPLTIHLLSPARRPVQVTRDLASFWREGYFAVRKDLRGRYPKHPWPDDPLRAEPTRRTTRRPPEGR